jgi:hypothetical protein
VERSDGSSLLRSNWKIKKSSNRKLKNNFKKYSERPQKIIKQNRPSTN